MGISWHHTGFTSSKHGESFLNYLVCILYSDSVYNSRPISFVCNSIIHSRKVDGGRIKRTGRGDFLCFIPSDRWRDWFGCLQIYIPLATLKHAGGLWWYLFISTISPPCGSSLPQLFVTFLDTFYFSDAVSFTFVSHLLPNSSCLHFLQRAVPLSFLSLQHLHSLRTVSLLFPRIL